MFARYQADKLVEIYGSMDYASMLFREFCDKAMKSEAARRRAEQNPDFLADLFYKTSVPAYERGEVPLMMFTPKQEQELLERYDSRENLMIAYRQFVDTRMRSKPDTSENLGQLFYDRTMSEAA